MDSENRPILIILVMKIGTFIEGISVFYDLEILIQF